LVGDKFFFLIFLDCDFAEIKMKQLWKFLDNLEDEKERILALNQEARVERVLLNSFKKLDTFCVDVKFEFKNNEKISFPVIR
jgi:cellulose biosynthesis protein BcsQ